MVTTRTLSQHLHTLHRITGHTTPQKRKGETTPHTDSYPPNELQLFKKIVLAMRDEALSILRDCQESVRSIEANEPSYGSRERPVSFNERSADFAAREEYALLIDRQLRLLGYLEAVLKRIDEGRFGLCVSCKELIARERLEAVPHTRLCLRCKDRGRPLSDTAQAQPSAEREQRCVA